MKLADFQHNINKILIYIKETMTLIREMEETYDSLLKDTFNTILTVPNTEFTQFFALKHMTW